VSRASSQERLLAAGRDLIHNKGFAESGVAQITAAAGVPKGSFYNHCPSKEAFGLAALDCYWAGNEPKLALLDAPGPSIACIARHFAAFADDLEAGPYVSGCLIGNLASEAAPVAEALRAHVGTLFAAWTRRLAARLAQGEAAGEVTAAVPAETLAT
jgi:TetR/AcrR family transcriptional repressor of nem operon